MKKINFNENWEYTNIDVQTNKDFDRCMTVFKAVDLPHDYTTDNDFDKSNLSDRQGGYVRTGTLWYRKQWKLDEIPNKPMFLLFDGVYSNSTLYVNGEEVYARSYGYSSFCVEITKYLKKGLNLIAVHIDGSKEPSTRWFNGQGITRNVWQMTGDYVYFENDGTFIKPQYLDNSKSEIQIQSNIINTLDAKNAVLNADILNEKNEIVASLSKELKLNSGVNKIEETLSLENTELWSIENPHLYKCVLSVKTDTAKDDLEISFGIRKIEFIANQGFFLNGVHTKIKGVCLHHDGGSVGAAVPKALWRKRILQLKEMGCNAIRTAHNPFNPEFYELCDELGMMVMDEAFDGWDIPKVKYGYSTIWEKWHEKDLADLVKRDRNHPSVILWSIGNEVLEMSTEITKELMGIIRNLDDTRKITAGVQAASKVSDDNRALLDVAGYNDGGGACFIYENDHEKRPEQLFIATEAPHSFQTRGFYRTLTWWRDKNQPRIEIENLTDEEIFFDQSLYYNSSYDNSGVRTSARDSWEIAEKLPYLCGEFRWTGYDYVGEAFPNAWPSKTHSFGVIDSANFEKDHFYLYQSMWKDEKMLHVLPHWTHRYMEAGTLVPVWVYTNCEETELFLNGKSLGKKSKGNLKNLEWLVPYEKGILTAKAYENGNIILEKTIKTASEPQKINVNAEILPEEKDINIAQVNFEIQDKNSNFVPYSNNITALHLSQNTVLLGSDNGAIDDMSNPKSMQRRAFNGLGMYLVKFDVNENNYASIVSILGDEFFDEKTSVSVDVKTVVLSGKCDSQNKIYYTLDGTNPNRKSCEYTKPFEIFESTQVKICVYKGDDKIITLSDTFVKGRQKPVIDLIHLNTEPEMDVPAGPFSEKIIGEWKYGETVYEFYADGKIAQKLGITDMQIGYWWYDFPADYLETPDYAGMGEIWLTSGYRLKFKLKSQVADTIIIDNSENKMGNIVANIKDVVLLK